ncbi:HAchain-likeQ2 phosphatase non-receptor type substrate 1-like isoform X2 [Podarcis lilfordi]|uniref:HAchain-likeQ2 phosphatase non-receptor type substrate 1-like isoform X2 n=1 Tax=Podarcis lilfordi TaxID=74358 RepID=A0AA35L6X6_9SAUR|nr:HAchain-likeQ2 phosphatase non-receptor type substrate 1-like isoform X2 [Podarcis lilfordi]
MPSFSCLLLFLQGAWAAVIIQVPSSPVQAGPHSNVSLPCHFSLDPPRPIDVDFLIVRWSLRGKNIAKFDTNITVFRPRGAVLDATRLPEGNASLYLSDVREEDAGEYTCFVLHTPDSAEGKVALKLEAPPRLTLGPTKVPLGKPINFTCAVSDFFPDGVSVKWLRDSETLKVDSPPAKRGANYLFYAQSVLEFTAQISDTGVTFSCHIQHQAAKDPIRQDIELKVVARPELHMLTRPSGKRFLVAECLACGFYPQNVTVQWLQNGEPIQGKIYESEVEQNPNGTFSTGSVFFPKQDHFAASFTCQVQHEALEAPLEERIPWEPEGYFRSLLTWLVGSLGHLVGLGMGVGATLMYQRRRAKYKQAEPNDQTLLKKTSKVRRENPDDVFVI